MGNRICRVCKIEKPINSFTRINKEKGYFLHKCKECDKPTQKANSKKYHSKPKTAERKAILKERSKRNWEKNKEKYKAKHKEWTKENKEYVKEKNRQWYKENNEHINAYCRAYWKKRRLEDPMVRLKNNTRRRVSLFLTSKKSRKNKKIEAILGCTFDELKCYIEKQFQPGMTWDNYGLKGWHIDHIIPLVNARDEEEMYKLFHFTNLQPMWAEDNLKKGSNII